MAELSLKEFGEQVDAKRKALYEMVKDAPNRVLSTDDMEEIDRKRAELDDLGAQYQKQLNAASYANELKAQMDEYAKPVPSFTHGGGQATERAATKSLYEIVTGSPQFKGRDLNSGKFAIDGIDAGDAQLKGFDVKSFIPNLQRKTLMSTSAGFAPPNFRSDLVVPYAVNVADVLDIIPQGSTNEQIVKYMEQTTRTNNAAGTAEGSAPTDSAFAYTERSDTVEKITGWIPVTDEQLADVEGLESILNEDLPYDLRLKVQSNVISGTGASNALDGFLHRSGVQSQAKGTDSVPDAIYKGIVLVKFTGRANPNYIVMHPNDWQDCVLLTDLDGKYIFGGPGSAAPPMIWGLPVVQNTDETENTALIGDFARYSRLLWRQGMTVQKSDSHGEYFTAGKQVIKATVRCTLQIKRAAAFCKVTGI